MKRYIIGAMIGLLMCSTGCENAIGDTKEVSTTNNDQVVTTITIPPGQGDNSTNRVSVRLVDGNIKDTAIFTGKFAIDLFNLDGELLSSIDLNEDDNITLQKGFEINFSDYNNDGYMDFSIGYVNNNLGNYRFFTVTKEQQLHRLNSVNFTWLQSSYTGASHLFSMVDDNLVNYRKEGNEYIYESIEWNEDKNMFEISYDRYSDIDYDSLNLEDIKSRLISIRKHIRKDISPTEIVDLEEDEDIKWFLDNEDKWHIYRFMNTIENEDKRNVDAILGVVNSDSIESLNLRLDNNHLIEEMSLDEFLNTAKDKYFDNEKQNPVFYIRDTIVTNHRYRAVYGSSRMDNFIFIYSDTGDYIDGYSWSDYLSDPEDNFVKYYPNQDVFKIEPVCYGRGTGIYVRGGKWLKVHKGRLVNLLEYIDYAHFSNFHYPSYDVGIKLNDYNYDTQTGDQHLKYKVSILLDNDNLDISTNRTIDYKWSTEQRYNIYRDNIYDLIGEYLIDDNIHDDLFSNNMDEITRIIRDDSTDESTFRAITTLLTQCSPSEKRDNLLIELKAHYEWISDNSTNCLEIINKEID